MTSSDKGNEFIEIQLFAAIADQIGSRKISLPWQPSDTVEDLAQRLCELNPAVVQLVRISRWAIDKKFVGQNAQVEPHQEIALIPPVSGG